MNWPDYCKRETLAKRLDIKPGAIDQYVKRGLLPPPIQVGEALLWRWADVDQFISGSVGVTSAEAMAQNDDDPYIAAIDNAAPQASNKPS